MKANPVAKVNVSKKKMVELSLVLRTITWQTIELLSAIPCYIFCSSFHNLYSALALHIHTCTVPGKVFSKKTIFWQFKVNDGEG